MSTKIKAFQNAPLNTRHVIKKDIMLNFIGNLLGGGGGAWLLFGTMDKIPPLGLQGFITDLAVTGLAIPLLLGSLLVYFYRRKTFDEALRSVYHEDYIVQRLPQRRRAAIWVISIAGLISTSLLISLPLFTQFTEGVSPPVYIVIKGLWLGVLSAIVVSLAARIASIETE